MEQPIPIDDSRYSSEDTWMNDAECKQLNPEVFFPSDGIGVIEAQRVCAACPVKAACLEYALTYRIEHGVWGGASERERRRLLRARRREELRTSAA